MAKKKFTPSAALGYKRIKPLYDKLQVEVVEQAQVIEELGVERVLLKTKLEHRVKKCKQAGLRVAELLHLCRAQQVRHVNLVEQLNNAATQLLRTTAQLHQFRRAFAQPELNQSAGIRIAALTKRNQALAAKNRDLAEQADKYRGELERIRLYGAYAIIVVGVLALGYALTVIH